MDFDDFYRKSSIPKTPSEDDEDDSWEQKLKERVKEEKDNELQGLMTYEDLRKLMQHILYTRYYRSDDEKDFLGFVQMCSRLMRFDFQYDWQILENKDGRLCPDYPGKILIASEGAAAVPVDRAAAVPVDRAAAVPVDRAAAVREELTPPGSPAVPVGVPAVPVGVPANLSPPGSPAVPAVVPEVPVVVPANLSPPGSPAVPAVVPEVPVVVPANLSPPGSPAVPVVVPANVTPPESPRVDQNRPKSPSSSGSDTIILDEIDLQQGDVQQQQGDVQQQQGDVQQQQGDVQQQQGDVPERQPSPERPIPRFLDEEMINRLFDIIMESRRVRRGLRFPVPVIFFEGKYVCRSAALHEQVASEWKENVKVDRDFIFPDFRYGMNTSTALYLLLSIGFTKAIRKDVDVLRCFDVGYIADLRVECTAKRFSNVVNSAEDYYSQYYREFKTAFVPYPEIPFFVAFHENRNVDELIYDWPRKRATVDLQLPVDLRPRGIDYSKYRAWKVLRLTQNYLLLLLNYVTLGHKGVLVHCLDGHDRTSLFISLLRLSLWADGLIHKRLSVVDIIYLTVTYDWYLFGHDFPQRLQFHLEIMRFCFSCVPYIISEEFSRVPLPSYGTSVTKREARLIAVWKVFMRFYNEAYEMVEDRERRRQTVKRRAEP